MVQLVQVVLTREDGPGKSSSSNTTGREVNILLTNCYLPRLTKNEIEHYHQHVSGQNPHESCGGPSGSGSAQSGSGSGSALKCLRIRNTAFHIERGCAYNYVYEANNFNELWLWIRSPPKGRLRFCSTYCTYKYSNIIGI